MFGGGGGGAETGAVVARPFPCTCAWAVPCPRCLGAGPEDEAAAGAAENFFSREEGFKDPKKEDRVDEFSAEWSGAGTETDEGSGEGSGSGIGRVAERDALAVVVDVGRRLGEEGGEREAKLATIAAAAS